jgi:lactate dehydrogenase-like 2-hydroxyacid dehydrogenase
MFGAKIAIGSLLMSERPLVAATRRLPSACERRIESQFRFREGDDAAVYTGADIAIHAEGAAALIVSPAEVIDVEAVTRLPASVKIIATVSVGFEHVDLNAAHARGIYVTHTPGALTDATADIALLLILGASRRATEATQQLRSGAWRGLRPTYMMGTQITGKRLGIVGLGRIGAGVALRARAFGMTVLYHNRRPSPDADPSMTFVPTLEDLLRQSDVLSLHCPLTSETFGLLSRARIALLPEGAIVINTARGGLVDDDALIEALNSGKIFAAGLDVFANEPALDPRYCMLSNAYILPHIGSATVETRSVMGMLAIDSVEAVLSGREPRFRLV